MPIRSISPGSEILLPVDAQRHGRLKRLGPLGGEAHWVKLHASVGQKWGPETSVLGSFGPGLEATPMKITLCSVCDDMNHELCHLVAAKMRSALSDNWHDLARHVTNFDRKRETALT
jgi:hypothetical protein